MLTTALLTLTLAGCQPARHPLVAIDSLQIPKKIRVTSRTFVSGGKIPMANSAYGAGISPDLSWSGVPSGAVSLLLLVQDPDTPHGLFTHWILYNIAPTVRHLPASIPSKRGMVAQGLQGKNDSDFLGYFGPQPPDAPPHHYHFQIFALKARLRPRPGLDTPAIYAEIHDKAICGGELVGTFQKP